MSEALPQAKRTECEAIAAEERGELGLTPEGRLDPWELAAALRIRVESIERFAGRYPEEIRELIGPEGTMPGAVSVFHGPKCRILYDPRAGEVGRAFSVAHELAHRLLEHTPRWFDSRHRIEVSSVEEKAADYLAGAMLVPAAGLATVIAEHGGVIEAAAHFGVSVALIRTRIEQAEIELPRPGDEQPALGESARILLASLRPEEGGGEPAPSGSPAA
jgi:IrrE N-terminal-like domain